jgi:hypothetical protein
MITDDVFKTATLTAILLNKQQINIKYAAVIA